MRRLVFWLIGLAVFSSASCDQTRKPPLKPASSQEAMPSPVPPIVFYSKAKWVTLYEASNPEQDNDGRWIFKKAAGHWRLTETQREAFESTFYNIRGDGHAVMACEEPHYFFRYYNADGVQIGEVVVDPDSKNFHAYPNIFTDGLDVWTEVDAETLKALIASIKKPLKRGC